MNSALKEHCRFFPVLLLWALSSLPALPAAGQQGMPIAPPGSNLSPSSRAVIDRLASLGELPAGTWKMHAGDLTHGEAVNLDESDWQSAVLDAKEPTGAIWFRQTFQVPKTMHGYDLTGVRIWFQFHADANGPMPEILYFNGNRVAIGEDLEPIVMLDDARPGDKVLVAVKLLDTVDTKNFHGATLRIEFARNRPNPEDLRQEFLSAALLLPSLAPGDGTSMDLLNAAISAVDVAALDHADSPSAITKSEMQFEFDTSLKAAHVRLEALRPLLQKATFHLTGNSHIDAAWLWPWTETVDVVRRTYGTALQLMHEYPGYTFTQSAAAYNNWLAEKYPLENAEIRQRIQEGRWEIVGGMWVEPDLNMPDGESLVRQLLVGKRWYKQAYGVDVRIGWNPDSFGYTWQLPQIYKKSDIDYFVTQKMTWNDTNQLPFKLFWWESPDGSKVLTYFPHDYGNRDMGPERLSEDLAAARERATGMTEMMDLYGVGDHGGGPTRAMLDEGFHWAAGDHVTPKYQFGTAQNYFSSIETEIAPQSRTWNYESIAKGYEAPPAVPGKVSIPTWKSELYFEYHRGVMTTQANHKHNMRTAEEEVLNAEKWSSLAWLDGKNYPTAELTEDWKKVLFNQFHDLAAGSGIAVIYRDAQKDYDWVRMSTNEISAGALETIAERIDTQTEETESVPVVVFNPLGWERSGDVRVHIQFGRHAQGDEVSVYDRYDRLAAHAHEEPVARIVPSATVDERTGVTDLRIEANDIPPFGYEVLWVRPDDKNATEFVSPEFKLAANSIAIDNEKLIVTVDRSTGCITSLFDRIRKVETLAAGACGDQLQLFKDTPKDYDAWNIDPGTLDVPPSTIDRAESVEIVGAKSENPSIQITRRWQSSKFVQTISLGSWESDAVDIDNDIDWHEAHVLLKAAFPLAVTSNFATYEIPYGTIERPTTRNNSWEKAQFEVPAMRWADLSGAGADGKVHGLSLLNQDKYGYDAVGNVLRLTLLRSPKWPDPDADMGHHHFHYALYPHAGTWKDALTVRHGWEYDYPLQALVTTAHAGSLPAEHSFASVSPENVVLAAVKKAEDANGLILRVYEWAGKESTVEFHVPPGATGATVTNLMEEPEGGPLTIMGDEIKAPIRPYEILTIRVDYAKAGE